MTKPRDAVFAGVALLVGLSRVDAAFYLTGRDLVDGLDAGRLGRMLRTYVQNTFVYHRQYIYDVLVHQYTDWERTVADAASRRDSLVQLLADGLFVAPGVELAQRHAALGASATYMYILDYPSRVTVSVGNGANDAAMTLHSEDLAYAFGAPLVDDLDPFSTTGFTRADRVFSELVLMYWTNFIKTGNPNEPRIRSKSRNSAVIEWPTYDLESQEMLKFERKLPVRLDDSGVHLSLTHHYRGSKMALWLELIPKLHKSDHLDTRYHQLDDWDNVTSFEAEGTRLTSRADLLTTTFRPRLSRPPPLTRHSTTVLPTTTRPTTTSVPSTTLAAGGRRQSPAASMSTLVVQLQSADERTSTDTSAVSLSVTIAVGSFLLFINILVFVAVYYQKDRIRRERRHHKADLRAAASQQLHYRHDDVDGVVARTDSLSSDVRSNLSLPYGCTPGDTVDYPVVARSTRSNHHQYAGGMTLPRLTSPPVPIDAPAYGTVRSRVVPRWSTQSEQVELAYSECMRSNGGVVHKCPTSSSSAVSTSAHLGLATSTELNSPLSAVSVVTLDDSRKPSTVV